MKNYCLVCENHFLLYGVWYITWCDTFIDYTCNYWKLILKINILQIVAVVVLTNGNSNSNNINNNNNKTTMIVIIIVIVNKLYPKFISLEKNKYKSNSFIQSIW